VTLFRSASPHRVVLAFLRGRATMPTSDDVLANSSLATAVMSTGSVALPVDAVLAPIHSASRPTATAATPLTDDETLLREHDSRAYGSAAAGAEDSRVLDAPVDPSPRLDGRLPLTAASWATVELLVSPFDSFQSVGHFQRVLDSTPGVHATRLRRLQHGALQVRVACHNSTDLIESLRDTCRHSFRFRIQSQDDHRVEVVLEVAADEGVAYAQWPLAST